MPGELQVPGIILRATGPVPFPVLDESGTDITALLADHERGARLSGATLTIAESHVADFRSHLLRCLPRIAGNRDIEDYVRAWLLHRALLFEAEAVLSSTDRLPQHARGLLEVTRDLGREGASWAGSDSVPSYRHRERVEVEYSPLAHAVNTALYATSLGAAAGEHSHEILQGVALAAVFADTGLDEPTDAARVDHAAAFMRRVGVVSVGAAAGVLARRTRWDGTGIPAGIGGSSIPFEARCTAIACDYDLLTLTGRHGSGCSPYEALSQMGQTSGTYDPALLRVFIRLIGKIATEDPEPIARSAASRQADRLREMARAIRLN